MHTRDISCQMLSIKFHISLITHLYGSMSLLVSVCLRDINPSLPSLQEKRLHQFIDLLFVDVCGCIGLYQMKKVLKEIEVKLN